MRSINPLLNGFDLTWSISKPDILLSINCCSCCKLSLMFQMLHIFLVRATFLLPIWEWVMHLTRSQKQLTMEASFTTTNKASSYLCTLKYHCDRFYFKQVWRAVNKNSVHVIMPIFLFPIFSIIHITILHQKE
jgi:hypothetical protein